MIELSPTVTAAWVVVGALLISESGLPLVGERVVDGVRSPTASIDVHDVPTAVAVDGEAAGVVLNRDVVQPGIAIDRIGAGHGGRGRRPIYGGGELISVKEEIGWRAITRVSRVSIAALRRIETGDRAQVFARCKR